MDLIHIKDGPDPMDLVITDERGNKLQGITLIEVAPTTASHLVQVTLRAYAHLDITAQMKEGGDENA